LATGEIKKGVGARALGLFATADEDTAEAERLASFTKAV